MFTINEIKVAHSKVKSGADFPTYIKEIKALGVISYDAYVSDGHVDYFGTDDHTATAPAKYDPLLVAVNADADQFKADLKSHQQGQTDYPSFCNDCAKSGIEKWKVDLDQMTCTYYDAGGKEVLIEQIPG